MISPFFKSLMAVLCVVALTLLVSETPTIWWAFQSGLVGFLLIAGTIDTIRRMKKGRGKIDG